MLSGFFTGVSGSYYNEQKLGVISNNLANANTAGFRRSLMLMRTREDNPYTGNVDRHVRKQQPRTYGIQRLGIFKDYERSGILHQTNSVFDIAIPSELKNAFFMVRKAGASAEEIRYTRNGTLSIGNLDPGNSNSPSVLYLDGHLALDANRQPISIDPSNGEVKIQPDGTIFQGDMEIGQLPIYRLNKGSDPTSQSSANLQALRQEGDSLYKIPESLASEFHPQRIKIGQEGIDRTIIQGMQEGSNVNIYQELTEMISATKSFEANQKSLKYQLDTATKLFQMVRN